MRALVGAASTFQNFGFGFCRAMSNSERPTMAFSARIAAVSACATMLARMFTTSALEPMARLASGPRTLIPCPLGVPLLLMSRCSGA